MTAQRQTTQTPPNQSRAWLAPVGVLAGAGVLVMAFLLTTPSGKSPAAAAANANIPTPDESSLEPRVAQAIRTAREAVVASPDSVEAWAHYANVLDVHSLFAEAAKTYREALKLKPDDPQLTYFLAVTLWHTQGGAAEAETLLTRTAELQPKYPPPFARLATGLAASGRYDEARNAFERALEIDPTFTFAHRELGRTLLELGLTDDAIMHLQTAAQGARGDRETLALLAKAYRAAGRADDAALADEHARRSDDVLRLNDPVRDALEPLGVSGWHCLRRALDLLREGKFAKADEELTTVRETIWDNADVHVRLGEVYQFRDRKDAALREFRAALALRPDDPRAHLGVATLLSDRGQLKQALEHWKPAIAAFPLDAEAQLGYANSLAAADDVAEAIVHYEAASKLADPTAESLTNWGTALVRTGAAEKAEELYKRAIELDPKFADAHFNLGYLYEQQGRKTDAIAEYKLGAAIKPKHPAVKHLTDLEKEAGSE